MRTVIPLACGFAAVTCLGLFSAQAEIAPSRPPAQSRPVDGAVLAQALSPCKQQCSKVFDQCTRDGGRDGYCANVLTNCENRFPKDQ